MWADIFKEIGYWALRICNSLALMNDQCSRPSQLLVKTDIWSLKWIDMKCEAEMECVSQERPVSGGGVGGVGLGRLHPSQSDGITSKKRARSWQVNRNHHWCYLFSNVSCLTGDILFGTHPEGGRGAPRSTAPSHADSRSVLTPKQWDSPETRSGICHNPAPQWRKHKCTQLLVYTHPDLSRFFPPTSASATT